MTGNTSFELCTETLGFESGDCSVGEGEEELHIMPSTPRHEEKVEHVCQLNDKDKEHVDEDKEEKVEGKRRKGFPPPLRWMSTHAGKQSSYMKSERKDGRLILTEVRMERPEVFQVTRENGRLRFCVPWKEEKVNNEEAKEGMEQVKLKGVYSYQGGCSQNRMKEDWLQHGFVTTA